MFFFIF